MVSFAVRRGVGVAQKGDVKAPLQSGVRSMADAVVRFGTGQKEMTHLRLLEHFVKVRCFERAAVELANHRLVREGFQLGNNLPAQRINREVGVGVLDPNHGRPLGASLLHGALDPFDDRVSLVRLGHDIVLHINNQKRTVGSIESCHVRILNRSVSIFHRQIPKSCEISFRQDFPSWGQRKCLADHSAHRRTVFLAPSLLSERCRPPLVTALAWEARASTVAVGQRAHWSAILTCAGSEVRLLYNHMVVHALSDLDVDRIFGALADATRRDIMGRVMYEGLSVSTLAHDYAMSFAAVQKHVSVLERASLVTKRRHGREQIVSGNSPTVERAQTLLASWEELWRQRAIQIADILGEEGRTT